MVTKSFAKNGFQQNYFRNFIEKIIDQSKYTISYMITESPAPILTTLQHIFPQGNTKLLADQNRIP